MKNTGICCFLFITALVVTGCHSTGVSSRPSGLPVRYDNARYDLTFFLPADWQGYSVSIRQIEDQNYSSSEDKQMTVGYTPMITLRHPQWRADVPYQDIPILVFTHAQWDALQHGELWPSIFAGGVMDELWHNRNYVFAMSSRTFGFNDELKDWKETQDVVKQNYALHPMPLCYPFGRGYETSVQKTAPEDGGHDLHDIHSHLYGIEGKVMSVEKTKSSIMSITVKLIHNLPTAGGWTPYDQPGDMVTIHFDEPVCKLGRLRLTAGTVVKVNFGMIDNTAQWGSNFSWLYTRQDGAFYNADGKKVEKDPPFS